MDKKIIIFANGQFNDRDFYRQVIEEDCFIITADGGTTHAINMGIIPHMVVGDMDSIDVEVYKRLKEFPTVFYEVPAEKEESDLELALIKALELKPTEIIIIGALGNRVDHQFANLLLLTLPLSQGIKARIIDERHEIYLTDQEIELIGQPGDYLSLFPLSFEVQGVETQGLKYPLKKETLFLGPSRGLSNEFTTEKAKVRIDKGILVVIKVVSTGK